MLLQVQMAYSSPFLFTLFLFLHHLFLLVKADDKLITELCSKTEEPVPCAECLKADPSSSTADGPALAKKAAHCAKKDAAMFQDEIFKLSENTSEPSLKKALDDCFWQYFQASNEFLGVRNDIDASDYDAAKGIVIIQVLPLVNDCIGQFDKSPGLPLPALVAAGTQIAHTDCSFVIGILSNI